MDYYKAKLCPYYPECADEAAGKDVVDYQFVSTYCEIHNLEGVNVESEVLDSYWKEDICKLICTLENCYNRK